LTDSTLTTASPRVAYLPIFTRRRSMAEFCSEATCGIGARRIRLCSPPGPVCNGMNIDGLEMAVQVYWMLLVSVTKLSQTTRPNANKTSNDLD
jgi:hypothetical protein